jgi:hypothetical protein
MAETFTLSEITHIPKLVLRRAAVSANYGTENYQGPAQGNIVDANCLVGELPATFLGQQTWTSHIDQDAGKQCDLRDTVIDGSLEQVNGATKKALLVNGPTSLKGETNVGIDGTPQNLTVWGTTDLKDDTTIADDFRFEKHPEAADEFRITNGGIITVKDPVQVNGADVENVKISHEGIAIKNNSTLSVNGISTFEDQQKLTQGSSNVCKIVSKFVNREPTDAPEGAGNQYTIGHAVAISLDTNSAKSWSLKVTITGTSKQNQACVVGEYFLLKQQGSTSVHSFILSQNASNGSIFRLVSGSSETHDSVSYPAVDISAGVADFLFYRDYSSSIENSRCDFQIVCEFADLVGTADVNSTGRPISLA